MRIFLLVNSIIGILLFGTVFIATFLSVEYIESSARSFIIEKIEHEIKEKKVAGVKFKDLESKLGWLKEKYDKKLESSKGIYQVNSESR